MALTTKVLCCCCPYAWRAALLYARDTHITNNNAHRQKMRISCLVILFMLHLMLVRTALGFFVCEPILPRETQSKCVLGDHLMYLAEDPTLQCWPV